MQEMCNFKIAKQTFMHMAKHPASKKIGLFLGPLVFLIIQFLPFEILSEKADTVIAIGSWMVCWWITEAVSISVTSRSEERRVGKGGSCGRWGHGWNDSWVNDHDIL